MSLKDLVFHDCLVVGFSRDAAHRTLTLTFEAYDANNTALKLAHYVLECSGLKDVQLRCASEFLENLNCPYDSQSDDQRADEIHELRRDAASHIHIVADMILGSFYCHECLLHRVVEVEIGV